eukprot:jgi/Mesvir1/8546/Mv18701-RA.1
MSSSLLHVCCVPAVSVTCPRSAAVQSRVLRGSFVSDPVSAKSRVSPAFLKAKGANFSVRSDASKPETKTYPLPSQHLPNNVPKVHSHPGHLVEYITIEKTQDYKNVERFNHRWSCCGLPHDMAECSGDPQFFHPGTLVAVHNLTDVEKGHFQRGFDSSKGESSFQEAPLPEDFDMSAAWTCCLRPATSRGCKKHPKPQ